MTEITVKMPFSESVKNIADKRFAGNLAALVNTALEFYLHTETSTRERLKKVVQEIRQEVQMQGGFDEKDLERRIREYRRTKYARRK